MVQTKKQRSMLMIGPWRAHIPTTVYAGQEFSMQFICTSPESLLCPPSFIIFFHGPTKLSVPPELLSQLNWTHRSPNEQAIINARFSIIDPGQYRVYAYPEFRFCSPWESWGYPYNKAVVQDTPFSVTVLPNDSTPLEEGFGTCTTEQIDDGRFVSLNFSKEITTMYNDAGRSYIYAPRDCKIPHRTVLDTIKLLPDANHIAYFGDSTIRSIFCTRVWNGLHGTVHNSSCDYISNWDWYHRNRWDYKTSYAVLGPEQGFEEPRNVTISFIWSPGWEHFESENIPTVLALDPPFTHIVVNMGLYPPPPPNPFLLSRY